MAPPRGHKRPTDSRQDSYDGSRPSPHRPGDLGMAQQGRRQSYGHQHNQGMQNPSYQEDRRGGRGGRRARGGRGGMHQGSHANMRNGLQRDVERNATSAAPTTDAVSSAQMARAVSPTGNAMSPPPLQVKNQQAANPTPTQPSADPQTPLQFTEPPPPPDPPAPYYYEFLTDEMLETWQDGGRNATVKTATDAFGEDDVDQVQMVFQELLRAGLDARLPTVEAGETIADILGSIPAEQREDFETAVLDIFSILIDPEIRADKKLTNPRIRPMLVSTRISPALMRELLEDKVLVCMDLVRDTFAKMFVRKQTNALYRQSNYNLLREESEGYSKLMTELFTTTNSQPPTSEVIEDTFENIKALIGAFDLDPGRVLDVTLDVFANLLVKHYRFFVRLLRQSSWWPTEQTYNGLDTEEQGFSSLPLWAQPNYPATRTTDDDLKHLEQLRAQRDRAFWDRARAVGMDAFFELGGRRVVGDPDIGELLNAASVLDDDVRAKETIEWVKSTKTLPPSGNPVAAQLLGFKLRFYASTVRDPSDTLPINLIWLAALLIKIGFISLRDLYPHLFPDDEAMPALKDKSLKEREEREIAKRPGGGMLNALARAGALVDDTLPPSVSRLREPATRTRASTPSRSDPTASQGDTSAPKVDEEPKEQLPEPSDQKIELLKALLCIGAIPEVLYMLGRFPWLMDGFPDLIEHIHRIIHYSLGNIYQTICPLTNREGIRQAARVPSLEQSGLAKGELRRSDPPAAKTLQWPKIDRKNLEGIDYEFYWHDWSDNVPLCQNVDDVFTLCSTFLNFTGVKVGQDPALLMKLARIGKHSLSQDSSEANKTRWIDLCKRLLAPALSLTGCNPGVVNEMYDLLKFFETPIRYSIYNEWFLGSTSRLLDIDSAFAQARAETKDILKRMSKTNMRPMARALAKAACASPGIVFQVVLNQIESYNNLIDVVVECGRYFTYMGYDVLTWALLMTLGKAGRSRVSQSTGITTSLWLVSLSQFIGKVFRRYTVMNPLPILQYILEQLRLDNFADLQVLRELCINMAGIAPDTDFSDSQVHAMAGGELLQAQTLKQVHDKRHENKSSGRRLVKTLHENGLTGSMLVAIAQQRQMCIFHSNQNQVKAVGENVDGVGIVLMQFMDLMRHNMPVKDFEYAVPDVVSLIADFGVDHSIAFTIHRKGITKAIEEYDAANPPKKKRRSDTPQVNGDVEMNTGSEASVEKTTEVKINGDQGVLEDATEESVAATAAKLEQISKDIDTDQGGAVSDPSITDSSTPVATMIWHPVLHELMNRLKMALPEGFESSMSLQFFTSFWQLSINDIMLPTQSYTEEEARQKERIVALNADRTDPSASGARKKDSEKKQINDFLKNMKEEMKSRIAKHTQVRTRLEREKQHWFKDFQGKSMVLNSALLQECFLPRAVISPLDSYFAWRMLNMLHSSGTPGFRTMLFIDVLMRERTLINLMFQCTAREAENLGRFLYELLKELGAWHADKAEYEKRAYGPRKTLPGFVQKMSKEGVPEKLLEFEDFRKLLFKWHSNFSKAARFCIDTGEFMHLKNAIACLRATARVFPVVNFMNAQICKSLEPFLNKEVELRADVCVLSNSLYTLLKLKKGLMMPQAFRAGGNEDEALKGGSAGQSSREDSSAPKSPRAEQKVGTTSSKGLDPTAAGFQPKSNPRTNGSLKPPTSDRKDVEDGELDDAVIAEAAGASAKTVAEHVPPDVQTLSRTRSDNQVDNRKLAEIRDKLRASAEAKRQSQSQATGSATVHESANDSSAPIRTPHQNVDQATSRSATPSFGAQMPSSIPPRPRHLPTTNAQHTLPERPEGLPLHGRYNARDAHLTPDRPLGRGQTYQDSRPSRGVDFPQRPGDKGLRPNGVGPSDGLESGTKSRETPTEARLAPPRLDASQGRDSRPDSRDSFNARLIHDNGLRSDQQAQSTRDPGRRIDQPAASNGSPVIADPTMNPERAALFTKDQEKALLNDRQPRGVRSRPESPSRGDSRSDHGRPPRIDLHDDRQGDARGYAGRDHTRDQAPNGPRMGTASRAGFTNEAPSRPNSTMQPPNARPIQERGPPARFQEFQRQPRHQDESYGRLNADSSIRSSPPPQSPQGPRISRDMNGPSVPPSRPQSSSSAPAQPVVPAAYDRMPSTNSTAYTSHISTPSPAPAADRAAASETLSGVHPSRLAAFEREHGLNQAPRPPPIQTTSQTPNEYQLSSPPPQSPASSVPPSGPRSATFRGPDSPSAPRNAPAGPSDRGRRESARRFAGLQDALTGGSGLPNTPRNGPSQPQAQGMGASTPSGPANGTANANPNSNEHGASIRGLAIAGAASRTPAQQPSRGQQHPSAQMPQVGQQDLFASGRSSVPSQQTHGQGQGHSSRTSTPGPAAAAGVERIRDEGGQDSGRERHERDAHRSGSARGSYRSSHDEVRTGPEQQQQPDRERDRERDHGERERRRESRGYDSRDAGSGGGGRDGRPHRESHREREREPRELRDGHARDYDRRDLGAGQGSGNARKRPYPDDRDARADFGPGAGRGGGGADGGARDLTMGGSMKRPRRGHQGGGRE